MIKDSLSIRFDRWHNIIKGDAIKNRRTNDLFLVKSTPDSENVDVLFTGNAFYDGGKKIMKPLLPDDQYVVLAPMAPDRHGGTMNNKRDVGMIMNDAQKLSHGIAMTVDQNPAARIILKGNRDKVAASFGNGALMTMAHGSGNFYLLGHRFIHDPTMLGDQVSIHSADGGAEQ